jgi:REP-associated tyrosine transposase
MTIPKPRVESITGPPYREFVRDGIASRPWDDLKGQIYLGSEAFIEKHAAGKKRLKEIPRAQWRAAKPSLHRIFSTKREKAIAAAYEHGYRLNEIAARLGVHYATVSRRLKRIEQSS